uniref:SMYD family member 5 n=1 Tax=Gouania willdenowi TaxID=441366 RepID=A0A8C5H4Y9_GOUWI
MAAPVDDMFSLCVEPSKATGGVEVRFIDNTKGKGLFAKKSIRKGETIFIERPLVCAQFLWNAQYKYKACDFCLRALETAEENAQRLSGIPGLSLPHPELCPVRPELHQTCPQCQVMYCSSECRQRAADQYHQSLCLGPSQDDPDHPINKLKDAWRSMHYPPETSSIMLMARMVAMVKQAKDKAHWQKLFSYFCSRTANEEEEIAHKLLGEQFRGGLSLLHSLFTAALYDEHLSRWFVPEGFRSLFALVGTNGQGIGTSSLSQWVHACDALDLSAQQRAHLDSFIDQLYKDIEKETMQFLKLESFKLLMLLFYANAHCSSVLFFTFQEICISYLDCCQRDRSRHSRQKTLRENYLFTCSCPKCTSQMDELDVTSEEEEEEEAEAEGETEGDEMEDEMTDV